MTELEKLGFSTDVSSILYDKIIETVAPEYQEEPTATNLPDNIYKEIYNEEYINHHKETMLLLGAATAHVSDFVETHNGNIENTLKKPDAPALIIPIIWGTLNPVDREEFTTIRTASINNTYDSVKPLISRIINKSDFCLTDSVIRGIVIDSDDDTSDDDQDEINIANHASIIRITRGLMGIIYVKIRYIMDKPTKKGADHIDVVYAILDDIYYKDIHNIPELVTAAKEAVESISFVYREITGKIPQGEADKECLEDYINDCIQDAEDIIENIDDNDDPDNQAIFDTMCHVARHALLMNDWPEASEF